MLVFRSVTMGLLGACIYLLTDLAIRVQPADTDGVASPRLHASSADARTSSPVIRREEGGNKVTLIDVAPNVPAATIASLVVLKADERIISVADRYVASNVVAGTAIAEQVSRGAHYIDLMVSGDGTMRRVLILLHSEGAANG
jgi:hypothetical protein